MHAARSRDDDHGRAGTGKAIGFGEARGGWERCLGRSGCAVPQGDEEGGFAKISLGCRADAGYRSLFERRTAEGAAGYGQVPAAKILETESAPRCYCRVIPRASVR